jgi:hypothetical protein
MDGAQEQLLTDKHATYVAPVLIPIGNLRDLVAGTGTQTCDAGCPALTGPDMPLGAGMCPNPPAGGCG